MSLNSFSSATKTAFSLSRISVAEEKELSDIINTLERAIGILEKELKTSNIPGAAMLQMGNVKSVAQALSVLVQASMLNTADAQMLTSFVQSSDSDSDDDVDAPAGDVYESHTGGILETLGELLEKAKSQLDASRKKETTNLHNFDMLKASLEDH